MIREPIAFLHIHSGLHSGAVIPLNRTHYRLGSDDACDLILQDQHINSRILTLRIETPKVTVQSSDESSLFIGESTAGAGPLTLSMPSTIAFAGITLTITTSPSITPPFASKTNPAPLIKSARLAPRLFLFAVIATLVAILTTSVTVLFFTRKSSEDTAIKRLANLLIYNQFRSVQLHRDSTGGMTISGILSSEADRRALLDSVRAYALPVRTVLRSDEAICNACRLLLDLYPVYYTVRCSAGIVFLGGVCDDRHQLQRLAATLIQDVSGIIDVRSNIVTTNTVYLFLSRRLAAARLDTRLRFEIAHGRVRALLPRGYMHAEQMIAWRKVQSDLVDSLGIHVVEQWTDRPVSGIIRTGSFDSDIDSGMITVVAGKNRYIALKDGRRLFEGARLKNGSFIKRIEATRIVLDNEGVEEYFYLR